MRAAVSRPGAWLLALTLAAACGGENANSPLAPSTTGPFQCAPRAAATVSGNVHDPAGRPIQGAEVVLAILSLICGTSARATTDAAGNYQTRADIVDGYQLQVTKPGFNDFRVGSYPVRGDTVLDVTLQPGATISGVVSEFGVGPLDGATVEVISGPDAGASTQTRVVAGVAHYSLNVLPGDVTLRASKAGYDSVERLVHAPVSTTSDFVLKWPYGACLQAVTPIAFNDVSHNGTTGAASVVANAGRTWSIASDSPWVEVLCPPSQTGSGQVAFRVLPNAGTNARRGALMVRCSGTEGQNIWVTQNGDCGMTLSAAPGTPSVFPVEGGLGSLDARPSASICQWTARYEVEWIGLIGEYVNRSGTATVRFQVLPNKTGAPRTGSLSVGGVQFPVSQQ